MDIREKQCIKTLDVTKQNGKTVYTVLASSGEVDRDNEVVLPEGWILEDYLKHPIITADHRNEVMYQVGESLKTEVSEQGLIANITYYSKQGNPLADWCDFIASQGKAAYSVWARAQNYTTNKSDPVFQSYQKKPDLIITSQALMDITQTPVPSLASALQLGLDKEKTLYMAKSLFPIHTEWYEWDMNGRNGTLPTIEKMIQDEVKKHMTIFKTPQNEEMSEYEMICKSFGLIQEKR